MTFLTLWVSVVNIIAEVANRYDAMWQQRKRVIDSLLLVSLIFRLVFSKNTQRYGTTMTEFWHNYHQMKFPLPQKQAISVLSSKRIETAGTAMKYAEKYRLMV